MNIWNIGLSPWIIADGNYHDFHREQITDFALEFYAESGKISQTTQKFVELIEGCRYKAVAEVMFYSAQVWVLDFGVCAFNESKVPLVAKVGDFVEVEFDLGIDPFFYFERLYKLPSMLPLIYTWRIDKVIEQSAPLIGKWNSKGQRWYEPDASNYSFREVEQTGGKEYDNEQDAYQDYSTSSLSYILNCTRVNADSKFKRD